MTRYLVQYLRPICSGAVLTTELFHFSGTIRHLTSAASSVVMYVRLHCHEVQHYTWLAQWVERCLLLLQVVGSRPTCYSAVV